MKTFAGLQHLKTTDAAGHDGVNIIRTAKLQEGLDENSKSGYTPFAERQQEGGNMAADMLGGLTQSRTSRGKIWIITDNKWG